MSRLFPPEHLPVLRTVHVNRGWLESLALLHNNERPPKRRSVDQIDVSRTKAVLATDLLGGTGALGVEIKVF
jgi:inositol-pentakisphosphate 2-kinase